MRAPVHAPPSDAALDSGPDSGPVEAELPLILPAERTPAEDAPDNYVPDESLPDEDMLDENGGGRSDFARPAQDDHAACNELHTLLEGLLFVAGEPVAPAQLARALGTEEATVVEGLRSLAAVYAQQNRGLRIQAHREKYQLVTAPVVASHVERFLNLDTSSKLSGPALETLAVVAYRQPVTRSQVEAVRGVDCAAVLRSLTQRGLIEEVGRLDVAGRPFLYGVTELFMQHFGLTDLDELPPLEQTEADTLWAATALAELEGQDAPPESADDSAAPVAPVAAADSPARNAR